MVCLLILDKRKINVILKPNLYLLKILYYFNIYFDLFGKGIYQILKWSFKSKDIISA